MAVIASGEQVALPRNTSDSPVAEPDVYWSENGIDADLGLQSSLYAFVQNNPNQKEE